MEKKLDELKVSEELAAEWRKALENWNPCKGRMEVEYDDNGNIIKITYYN